LTADNPVLSSTLFSAICYRPSVCPSVTRVDQSKTAAVRIMQPSPQSSNFQPISRRISETVQDRPTTKVTIYD